MLLFILTSFFLPFESFLVCTWPVILVPWPRANTCQIHWCSWTACLASSTLCRGRHQHRSTWAGVQSWSRGLCPKAWDDHHPASQLPACSKLAQVRCQLLPCLPPAAADDAEEGKAARHGLSELERCGASFLPGVRVFTLNQRLAKWQRLRSHYLGFSTGHDFSC